MRYLSARWFDAARHAMAADPSLPVALAGITLTVEQTVEDGPDGTVSWHIAISDGAASLVPAPAEKPDLRFTTAYATAAAIASGALAAQRAFVEGRLRVGGDLSLLTAHQRAIAALDDALAPVRAETSYE